MLDRAEIRHEAMIRLMIGRDLKSLYLPPAAPAGASALDILDVRTATYPDRAVSLSVHRGEILGLAGLVGSGRTELARAIFGIDRLVGGAIRLEGDPIAIGSPRAAIDYGIYLVPEDRKRAGLLVDLSVAENISLPDLEAYARGSIVVVRCRSRQRRAPEAKARHSRARRDHAGQHVVRWQPAEGRAGEMAFDEAARDDLR